MPPELADGFGREALLLYADSPQLQCWFLRTLMRDSAIFLNLIILHFDFNYSDYMTACHVEIFGIFNF